MSIEIERKFLITGDNYKKLTGGVIIHQGFLNSNKERVVRVRIMGEKAYLTIKGITIGATRKEFEYEIPLDEAREMLDELCEKPAIKKHRYTVVRDGFKWEVDEFHGDNEGLVLGEIELEDEGQIFPKPDWVGEEVTGDPKYYNINLVKNPYKNWK